MLQLRLAPRARTRAAPARAACCMGPPIIAGTCRLVKEGVKLIVCLQQDSDMVCAARCRACMHLFISITLRCRPAAASLRARSSFECPCLQAISPHRRSPNALRILPRRRKSAPAALRDLQEYFSLDIAPVQQRCEAVGVRHERLRINDFDPVNLRQRLPAVVRGMATAHAAAGGTAYVHCTAGAPPRVCAGLFAVQVRGCGAGYGPCFPTTHCHCAVLPAGGGARHGSGRGCVHALAAGAPQLPHWQTCRRRVRHTRAARSRLPAWHHPAQRVTLRSLCTPQLAHVPQRHDRARCAGIGRAPAVALAYMWWVQGHHLEAAHADLLAKRKCVPKLHAIREATADMLFGAETQAVTIRKRGSGNSAAVEVAGAPCCCGRGGRWPVLLQMLAAS